jgi:aerobic-type carbon monoxide dehydrogenase small subunit (CoxS/CutS family)
MNDREAKLTESGQAAESIVLRVNAREHSVAAAVHHTLLEVLRDQLHLLSVREGCGIGMCGACTVLLDGQPVSSCLTLAVLAAGREILTVEGLGSAGQLDAIQAAFIARTGFQCSYCTPGIILTARALLAEQPHATDDEIREYLAGNLCRCGSYVKIVDSVREAVARLGASGQSAT